MVRWTDTDEWFRGWKDGFTGERGASGVSAVVVLCDLALLRRLLVQLGGGVLDAAAERLVQNRMLLSTGGLPDPWRFAPRRHPKPGRKDGLRND